MFVAAKLILTCAATPGMTRRAAITAATAVGDTAWTRSRPSSIACKLRLAGLLAAERSLCAHITN